MSSADESLARAEELLGRVTAARVELERLSADGDPDAAIDVLTELAELAREVEAALQEARLRAGASG